MKTPFETRTIEQAIETLIDYRGKTPPKTTSGVWLITAKVIKDGFIQSEGKEYIAADFYDEWMRRGLPQQWDVLVTTEAPLGEVAQIRTTEKIALAQRVILLRANPHVMHQGFLYHAMKSPFVQGELKARSSGTTVLGIKQSELWKVRVPWFPLPTQRKIAGILSAYDDLIENNTRRIAILEEMAQAIYREWFVHFRFPGHEEVKLVKSQLGKIPEGWKAEPLSSVADVNALSIKKGKEPDEAHYVDIASVSTGTIGEVRSLPFSEAPGRARRIVRHGDLIWSTVRPNRKSYSLILRAYPSTEPMTTSIRSGEQGCLVSLFTEVFVVRGIVVEVSSSSRSVMGADRAAAAEVSDESRGRPTAALLAKGRLGDSLRVENGLSVEGDAAGVRFG